jgi:hypothetical protein
VQIIITFGVDTLVNCKVFTVFLRNKSMGAVRASQGVLLRKAVFLRAKFCITDLTADLTLGAVILIKIRHRSITAWACASLGYITLRTPGDRFNYFLVALFVVFQKPLILNGFVMDYLRKDISFEFLIFGRVSIIKGPLLQRNVFSDKK